jgi:signal transduction histidine kinase
LAVTCDVAPAADSLRPAAAAALWHIAQEALTNVERHAGATAVTLRLTFEPPAAPDRVALTISDNGRGLPPDAENRPGHYGLRGMRERAEGLGGTLISINDNGTRLTAEIPLV